MPEALATLLDALLRELDRADQSLIPGKERDAALMTFLMVARKQQRKPAALQVVDMLGDSPLFHGLDSEPWSAVARWRYRRRISAARAAVVHGQLPVAKRDHLIAGLGTGEIEVLTSCEILGEGIDIPTIGCAILLRPPRSLAVYLQQVAAAYVRHPASRTSPYWTSPATRSSTGCLTRSGAGRWPARPNVRPANHQAGRAGSAPISTRRVPCSAPTAALKGPCARVSSLWTHRRNWSNYSASNVSARSHNFPIDNLCPSRAAGVNSKSTGERMATRKVGSGTPNRSRPRCSVRRHDRRRDVNRR
jgi:helicase-like protein